MGTALVTGASAGLGRSFARALASRGHDVVLVARDAARLTELAAELEADHGVAAEVLPADLSDREALARVAERVGDPDRPVDLLVNNAGFGLRKGALDGDPAELELAVDVMVRAVLVLSLAGVRAMAPRGRGAVLNVSSVAGYAAMGTYSAIKAWVTTFSEGLATELRGTGVTVTALVPGFVRTEFHDRAKMHMSRLPAAGWLDADAVVREALDDVARGRVVSVPSRRYRLASAVLRHAPRSLVRSGSAGLVRRRHG